VFSDRSGNVPGRIKATVVGRSTGYNRHRSCMSAKHLTGKMGTNRWKPPTIPLVSPSTVATKKEGFPISPTGAERWWQG